MDSKKIITILTDIESNFDVNSLTLRGLCVWPYIRFQIAYHLTHKDRNNYSPRPQPSIINPKQIINFIIKYASLIKYLIPSKPLNKSDILFLSRTSERTYLVNGGWYNKYCDSFFDLFEKTQSIQILEFSDDGRSPTPEFRPSYHLEMQLLINRIHYEFVRHFKQSKINNYDSLEKYLRELNVSLPCSPKELTYKLGLILSQKKIFCNILQKCKPKLFFLVCYYYEVAMAAVLACHELGVPAVEFQHGAQNDNNPFLTHWTKAPHQGYELLPDFFWNWGETSAIRINKWAGQTDKHKTFIGGNLWTSKWLNNDFETDDCTKYDVRDIFPKGYKHIFISMQLWPDHFPDYLLKIIGHSPPNWYWHIRQHPRHKMPSKDLNKKFLSLPNVQIEEHLSREMPLYLILKHVDLHLTGFSTVAFEAAQFKVPTIFFHKNAIEGFKGLFDNKLFFYAENYDNMLNSINIIFNRNPIIKYESLYINTDLQTHLSCLEEMLKISQY